MDISATYLEALRQLVESADKVAAILLAEGTNIAKAIVRPILLAEMIFIGFRLLFKANIVEQLTNLTINVAILFFFIYVQGPQKIIGSKSVQDGLSKGAQTVATQILALGPAKGKDAVEPVQYWATWLGNPQQGDGVLNYSQLITRVWNAGEDEKGIAKEMQQSSTDGQDLGTIARGGSKGTNQAAIKSETKPGAQTALSTTNLLQNLMMFAQPFTALATLLQVAAVSVGCMLLPLFTSLGVLCASKYAFAIVMGCGVAVLPAILFHSFRKVWVEYLTILAALALIPPLFYILSAVGFVFATTAFDLLFPTNGQGSIAALLKTTFDSALGVGLNPDSILLKSMTDAAAASTKLFALLGIFSKILYGVTILSVFVAAGTGFGALSVPLAMKWNRAFSAEAILESIQRVFTGLQGAMGTGLVVSNQ